MIMSRRDLVVLDPKDYPNASKSKKTPDKKLKKVIKGTVTVKEPSMFQKVVRCFIPEEASNVKEYLMLDVCIPAIKNLLSDMINDGLNMMLFGVNGRRTAHSNRNGGRSNTVTPYTAYYGGRRQQSGYRGSPEDSSSKNDSVDYRNLITQTREEAQEVINALVETVVQYDVASIGDLLDLVGVTADYPNYKYGWDDAEYLAAEASIQRVSGGYRIILPKVVVLN